MTKEEVFDDKRLDTEDEEFKVADRRHWKQEETDSGEMESVEVSPPRPSIIEEYRQRAEAAEQKLLEYVEAFKQHKQEQEQFRARLAADVDRRVQLSFGEIVGDLLETVDDLDLSLAHIEGVPAAEPLAHGVTMARDSFLNTLERHGITKLVPDSQPFDPAESEAVRIDPVDSEERDGKVTETLKPGYRLGDRLLRAARVAVGRYDRDRSGGDSR